MINKPGFVSKDVSLARYSTLGVGGRASHFAIVADEEKLVDAYEFARDEGLDIFVLGRGSNVLFSDKYFRGLVLRMNLSRLNYKNNELWGNAGVLISSLVSLCEVGCTGYECFAGLPGTVGGAIYGNAGCYGGQFWDVVVSVRFFDGEDFLIIQAEPFMFRYRWSFFKDHPEYVIVSAQLKVRPEDRDLVAAETRRIRELRQVSQPKQKSAGCIFKNPLLKDGQRISAGKLLDDAKLKGIKIGQAQISDVHANYFINLGGASADDMYELVCIAKSRVFENSGILLEEEIIRVGEF